MNIRIARLGWWLVAAASVGCRTEPVDDGSLATMKRIQQSRLTYSCITEHAALAHGGLALEVIQACQKAADAMIW